MKKKTGGKRPRDLLRDVVVYVRITLKWILKKQGERRRLVNKVINHVVP
jgi:hypothetical protein